MTAVTQSAPITVLEPALEPANYDLSWMSVDHLYLSVGDPAEGDDEVDDFDENDFDDDFDDDFEEEIEDDEFESADPFQFDE